MGTYESVVRPLISAMAAILGCLFLPPARSAASAARIGLGLNLGVALPSGDPTLRPGGIWHLTLDYCRSRRVSVALELGTAANEIHGDRTMSVYGVPRRVTVHAVSTLGLLVRWSFRASKVRPYLAGGVDYYTSWDDVEATATGGGGTFTRSGLGLQAGAGSALWLADRWDLYAEGLYHFATNSDDDARYGVIQGGLRFFLGRREAPAPRPGPP